LSVASYSSILTQNSFDFLDQISPLSLKITLFFASVRMIKNVRMRRPLKKTTLGSILFAGALLALAVTVEAQQPKADRVGVITAGAVWYEEIDGLRIGLKQLGFEEGRQLTLEIRDTKGDMKAAEEAARHLEQEKVKLIFATQTTVALAARNATKDVPIVFCAGADPVNLGLVVSFRSPGGRLTGVFYRLTDVTGKRLEILKEIIPNLQPVVTFYNPDNPVAVNDSKFAREAARHIGVEVVEQHVASPKGARGTSASA
jgi:putative ABC transport system substrate-binding protein